MQKRAWIGLGVSLIVALTVQEAAAQASTDTTTSAQDAAATAKAQSDATAAYWAAVKAKADARSAQTSAAAGAFPASPTSGTTTTKDGAGQAEAAYLSAQLIKAAAKSIHDKTSAAVNGRKLTIFVGTDAPDLSAWKAFDFNRSVLNDALNVGLKDYCQAEPNAERCGRSSNYAVFPALGVGLTIGSKVLQMFSSDYEVGGISVNSDDYMLAVAVAGTFQPNVRIASQRFSLSAAKDLVESVNALGTLYKTAKLTLAEARARLRAIEKESAAQQKADADERRTLQAVAAELDGATAAYETFLQSYGLPAPIVQPQALGLADPATDHASKAAVKSVAAGEKGGVTLQPAASSSEASADKQDEPKKPGGDAPSLKDVLSQMAIAKAVAGGYGLFVKIHSTSGSYYTKKNIFTALDTEFPFRVATGAVVSYSLVDGDTDDVVAADLIADLQCYMPVTGIVRGDAVVTSCKADEPGRRPRRR